MNNMTALARFSMPYFLALFVTACGGGSGAGNNGGGNGGGGGDLPVISLSNKSINEGDASTIDMAFTVSLNKASNVDVDVAYTTANGTATAGSDYQAASGTLTIPAGSTSAVITVSLNGDTDVEPDETFTLTLANPTGATLGVANATGTIVNDDTQAGVNTPPSATIINWWTLTNKSRRFDGEGNDAEDGPLSGGSLVWSSDIDGVFGTGTVVDTSALSPGSHTISLTVTDSDGASTTTSITAFINQWPTVQITSPSTGSTFTNADDIVFSGSATDPEDGTLSGNALVWTSNRDGEIGTGDTVTSSLSLGTHVITLTATDSMSFSETTTLSVSISSIAWQTEPDLIYSIPQASSAVIGDKIYVIGNSYIMQVYDAPTATWSTTTSSGGQYLCALNGKLLSFGRVVATNNIVFPYEAVGVDEYDPATDTWTEKSNMPSEVAGASGCYEINGMIYLVGSERDLIGVNDGVYEYNPVTDTWTEKALLPYGRRYFASSVVNGKIYVIGGSGNGSTSSSWYTRTVFEYDPALNSWHTKAYMPTARKRFTSSAYNGKIYTFGGININGWSDAVEEYDPLADKWTSKSPMTFGRRSLASSFLPFDGKIYVIGGNTDPNGTFGLSTVESYDPSLD